MWAFLSSFLFSFFWGGSLSRRGGRRVPKSIPCEAQPLIRGGAGPRASMREAEGGGTAGGFFLGFASRVQRDCVYKRVSQHVPADMYTNVRKYIICHGYKVEASVTKVGTGLLIGVDKRLLPHHC